MLTWHNHLFFLKAGRKPKVTVTETQKNLCFFLVTLSNKCCILTLRLFHCYCCRVPAISSTCVWRHLHYLALGLSVPVYSCKAEVRQTGSKGIIITLSFPCSSVQQFSMSPSRFQCLMLDVVPDPANSKWAKECTQEKVRMETSEWNSSYATNHWPLFEPGSSSQPGQDEPPGAAE